MLQLETIGWQFLDFQSLINLLSLVQVDLTQIEWH